MLSNIEKKHGHEVGVGLKHSHFLIRPPISLLEHPHGRTPIWEIHVNWLFNTSGDIIPKSRKKHQDS